jgi:anthranilate phosphoribosyltransferase
MMIADAIKKVTEGQNLSGQEAHAAMTEIMEGQATPVQIAGFLVALRMKGETVEEITEFARVMREHAVPVKPTRRPLVDTCGTGGDKIKTFNVSTAAAFVAAGAGVAIAKHGNRSVTSKCGSADVLEALGVRIDLSPEECARSIDEVGLGFMFAPAYHPAMKHAGPVRRELAVRTVFNMLGPLTNPAAAEGQVLGVYDPALTEIHATALRELGSKRALVVHGTGGLDEFSTFGETRISELRAGTITTYEIRPEDFRLARLPGEAAVLGSSPEINAKAILRMLEGETGPVRDIVVLNAAAAIVVGGLSESLADALPLAQESLDSGAAKRKLEQLQAVSS